MEKKNEGLGKMRGKLWKKAWGKLKEMKTLATDAKDKRVLASD